MTDAYIQIACHGETGCNTKTQVVIRDIERGPDTRGELMLQLLLDGWAADGELCPSCLASTRPARNTPGGQP
jgi:hypothetical protein